MTVFSELLSSMIVLRLGWTLLHSVWQFALIAVLASALLTTLRRRSAQARYLAACFGLVAMLVAVSATYWRLGVGPTKVPAVTMHADNSPAAIRLPGQPAADDNRDVAVLPSGRVVGVAAHSHRARALL